MSIWSAIKELLPNFKKRIAIRNAIRSSLINAKQGIKSNKNTSIAENIKAGVLTTEALEEYHGLVAKIQNYPDNGVGEDILISEIDDFIKKLDRGNTIDKIKAFVFVALLAVIAVFIGILGSELLPVVIEWLSNIPEAGTADSTGNTTTNSTERLSQPVFGL